MNQSDMEDLLFLADVEKADGRLSDMACAILRRARDLDELEEMQVEWNRAADKLAAVQVYGRSQAARLAMYAFEDALANVEAVLDRVRV